LDTNIKDNRRTFSRFGFDAGCIIHQGMNNWSSKLIDISLKGLLSEMPKNWDAKESEPMEAELKLSDDDSATIMMSVELVHKEGGCLGFRCNHIDIDSITHLRRLVELNLGRSDLLERELSALINTSDNP
jgi:hypothetical protein